MVVVVVDVASEWWSISEIMQQGQQRLPVREVESA